MRTTLQIYEELAALKDDPIAFEQLRNEIIEQELTTSSQKQMQWKLEGELQKLKNPVARQNKMVELFWNGFFKFNNTLKGFDDDRT